jgi:hypothetical protein
MGDGSGEQCKQKCKIDLIWVQSPSYFRTASPSRFGKTFGLTHLLTYFYAPEQKHYAKC